MTQSTASGIDRLLQIMARLRDPESGCPWDLEQNFETIAPYTIEEAYEVADAIARQDLAALKDELGDLLLQVVFHAQMAAESRDFSFDDVAHAISDKMERRHPHVFGDALTLDWEGIKEEERQALGDPSALAGVALGLPALLRADKLQKRAARTGFDWPDPHGARAKVIEEIAEIDGATDADALEDEMGDLLREEHLRLEVTNWAFIADHLLQPGPDQRIILCFSRQDERHAPFGKGHKLGVEQIGLDRIGEAHAVGRHLNYLEFGKVGAQLCVKTLLILKGQLMRK